MLALQIFGFGATPASAVLTALHTYTATEPSRNSNDKKNGIKATMFCFVPLHCKMGRYCSENVSSEIQLLLVNGDRTQFRKYLHEVHNRITELR